MMFASCLEIYQNYSEFVWNLFGNYLKLFGSCLEMYCYCMEVDWKFNEIVLILFGNLTEQFKNSFEIYRNCLEFYSTSFGN